jgi:hypothetical protein
MQEEGELRQGVLDAFKSLCLTLDFITTAGRVTLAANSLIRFLAFRRRLPLRRGAAVPFNLGPWKVVGANSFMSLRKVACSSLIT